MSIKRLPPRDWLEREQRFAHLAADLDPLSLPLPAHWAELRARAPQQSPDTSSHLAIETGHIDDADRVRWIWTKCASLPLPSRHARRRALRALIRAEEFEAFLGRRYPGRKRFGVEGLETLHAVIQRLLDQAARWGVTHIVIGAMHRGRLGLMGCLLGQSMQELFARMDGAHPLPDVARAGDVPYHMGLETAYHAPTGDVRITLLPNPSHLEAVNGAAIGYARALQDRSMPEQVLPLLLHTDASVIAQGSVAELLQFAGVSGHSVGGSVHIIVNNQIGFTTDPHEARTSRWCTGQFKAIDSLIAHVNSDDVDATLQAVDLALAYRSQFSGLSVIDLIGMRVNGHNELDEPRFTQPIYYAHAQSRRSVTERFEAKLLGDGAVDHHETETERVRFRAALDLAYQGRCSHAPAAAAVPANRYKPRAPLETVLHHAARVPDVIGLNEKAVKIVKRRHEEFESGTPWALAEVLALGAILSSGRDVRLTGQDCARGAFSQRHFTLVDKAGRRHDVFANAPGDWGRLTILNTPLSEYAALAYAYGYSLAPHAAMTIWEAQFGDFANGAQIIFDQFIFSGWEKWAQRSNLTVLLPHGLEGQGPEHCSARIERFLPLCAGDNARLIHPSTPANYFHALLKQAEADRPLIVFTPKKLLRLKAAVSPATAFADSAGFVPIIEHAAAQPLRTILCSGKIAYDLDEALQRSGETRVSVLRLEQLYPFPTDSLRAALQKAPHSDLIWLQEEPENNGAGLWVAEQVRRQLGREIAIVARPANASPAGSFHARHDCDQKALVERALDLGGVGASSGRRPAA